LKKKTAKKKKINKDVDFSLYIIQLMADDFRRLCSQSSSSSANSGKDFTVGDHWDLQSYFTTTTVHSSSESISVYCYQAVDRGGGRGSGGYLKNESNRNRSEVELEIFKPISSSGCRLV
jgi:hypothetical protein